MSLQQNRDSLIDNFASKLKRRHILGSAGAALETAQLLRLIVSQTRWQTADQLLVLLRDTGGAIIKAQPTEPAVGNTVRRILKLIRDEYHSIPEEGKEDGESRQQKDQERQKDNSLCQQKSPLLHGYFACPATVNNSANTMVDSSMYNLLAQAHVLDVTAGEQIQKEFRNLKYPLKPLVIQGINELIDEIETAKSNMNVHALDHIQTGDHIITIGQSRTVEEFLISASKKRSFTVAVAETAPVYEGHCMAAQLAKAGIEVTLIPDSAIGATMGRVSKVVIGCHAVLANGGLMAITGTQLMVTCAAHYEIPVVVVTGIYKLSPLFPSDRHIFYCPVAPFELLDYDCDLLDDKTTLYSPYYDYVDPSLVSLFITNVGGHPPSYLYRLLGEFYDRNDNDLGHL